MTRARQSTQPAIDFSQRSNTQVPPVEVFDTTGETLSDEPIFYTEAPVATVIPFASVLRRVS
jgi:hypothetical protein